MEVFMTLPEEIERFEAKIRSVPEMYPG